MPVLAEASRLAPRQPGVYLFLDGDGAVVYVGTATDLRSRLGSHARGAGLGDPRAATRCATVERVVWEVAPSALAALGREADLIAALRPPLNGTHREATPWPFVTVTPSPAGALLALDPDPGRGGPGVFGCFTSLGKGKAHMGASRLSAGYVSLLRLLWVAGPTPGHIPRRIAGTSPPARHESPLAAPLHRPLVDFLAGRSDRVLARLTEQVHKPDVPPFMRPALERDAASAAEFFALGPRALHDRRRRHRLPAGPVDAATLRNVLVDEVDDLIACAG